MRNLAILFTLCVGLLLVAGCACGDKCCGDCSKEKSSCSTEKCGESCSCKGCAEKCGESCSCEGCAKLMAGKTGWCACGKGFFEGKEVKCKGECQANPGGAPCEACVK